MQMQLKLNEMNHVQMQLEDAFNPLQFKSIHYVMRLTTLYYMLKVSINSYALENNVNENITHNV